MKIELGGEIRFNKIFGKPAFCPTKHETFSSRRRYLRHGKLVHLFQGSQQEVEELPRGGLSLSIDPECNLVGCRHCGLGLRPNNPDGGLFIVTFLAHNPLIVRTMIIILLGGSNSDGTIPKSNIDDRLGRQKDTLLGVIQKLLTFIKPS